MVLEANACSPGILEITAIGQSALNELPRLNISLNSRDLGTMEFGSSNKISITVPQHGKLFLTYLNDYNQVDIRLAVLRRIHVINSPCGDSNVQLSGINLAVKWDGQLATLTSSAPLSLTPCSAGFLSLETWGRKTQGETPILEITQAGRVLQRIKTANWEVASIPVQAAPVMIRIINPLYEVVADRNLILQSVQFLPTP